MTEYQTMVQRFHARQGLPIGSHAPDLDVHSLLRIRLILEELGELAAATHGFDMVETADAITDLMYVTYGTAVTYGIHLEEPRILRQISSKGPRFLDPATMAFHICRIAQEAGDIAVSFENRDPLGLKLDLQGMIERCLVLADDMGIPIDTVFNLVHESNMTKTPLDKDNKGGKGPGFIPVDLKATLGIQE